MLSYAAYKNTRLPPIVNRPSLGLGSEIKWGKPILPPTQYSKAKAHDTSCVPGVDSNETQWIQLHANAAQYLASDGVFQENLRKLTKDACQSRKSSKLAQTLSGPLMGISVTSGIKTVWKIDSNIVPFHIAAAFGLTSQVLKAPVVYRCFYEKYLRRVNEALELVKDDVKFCKDLSNVVKKHAKSAYVFAASYYVCYRNDRNNFEGATRSIKRWSQSLFNAWDNEIRVIKAHKTAQYEAKILAFISKPRN
jgi:hypothetical protein